MNICVPRERRSFEFRVGLTPAIAGLLVKEDHTVYVEHDAGLRAGFTDEDYRKAGAQIVYSCEEAFGRADLLLKVARPQLDEISFLRPGAVIAGLLHLASTREEKIRALEEKQVTALAYEQIRLQPGDAPIRRPLAEIGGRLAAQIGSRLLQNDFDGKGILLMGAAGVPPAEVVVVGAGVSGSCAIESFVRMGAHVTVLDTDLDALRRILESYPCAVTQVSNSINIEKACAFADLLVTGAYIPGQHAPLVVTRQMVKQMKPRSVIIDLSIDEGGNVETSRPTNHQSPTFIDEGVIHYCVPNIPSVVARTSTYALTNAAFPFIHEIASKGIDTAAKDNPAVGRGVQIFQGHLQAHPPHEF